MGAGQVVDFAPDGADFVGFAAVEADSFVEDATAHGIAFNVVVVAFHQRGFLVAFLFGERFDVFVADGVERVLAPVFVSASGFGHCVCFVVAFVAHVFAQLFIVDFVAVFAFYGLAGGLGQFELNLAMLLDFFVGGFEGCKEFGFRNLVHLSFNHHDVFGGCAYHQFHVGAFKLLESGVDYEFAVNAGHTHFRDGAVERDIAHGYGCRCGEPCEGVGDFYTVG